MNWDEYIKELGPKKGRKLLSYVLYNDYHRDDDFVDAALGNLSQQIVDYCSRERINLEPTNYTSDSE